MSHRSVRRLVVACAAAAVLLAASPAAHARDVSLDEFRALAAAAVDDPSARTRLLAVDSVEGRRVDVETLLLGATEEQTRARLTTLAAPLLIHAVDSRAMSDDAREILSGGRFKSGSIPRPLHGLLRRIGEMFEPVWRAVVDLIERIPGPRALPWILLALAVIVAASLATSKLAARRGAPQRAARLTSAVTKENPAALEKAAEAAERRGEFERAIRLRFRAGLLRLDSAGAIEFRPSNTTGDIARSLHSETFDELSTLFDSVVYGRREAGRDDVSRVRAGWDELLTAARA